MSQKEFITNADTDPNENWAAREVSTLSTDNGELTPDGFDFFMPLLEGIHACHENYYNYVLSHKRNPGEDQKERMETPKDAHPIHFHNYFHVVFGHSKAVIDRFFERVIEAKSPNQWTLTRDKRDSNVFRLETLPVVTTRNLPAFLDYAERIKDWSTEEKRNHIIQIARQTTPFVAACIAIAAKVDRNSLGEDFQNNEEVDLVYDHLLYKPKNSLTRDFSRIDKLRVALSQKNIKPLFLNVLESIQVEYLEHARVLVSTLADEKKRSRVDESIKDPQDQDYVTNRIITFYPVYSDRIPDSEYINFENITETLLKIRPTEQ